MALSFGYPTTHSLEPREVRVTEDNVTPVSEWKSAKTKGHALKVPSGNVALVRNPGMQAFLRAGLIPNSLMPLVTEALERGKPPSPDVLGERLKNLEVIDDMMQAIDSVTIFCVIEPKVTAVPTELTVGGDQISIPIGDPRRNEDLLYVDEVDEEDKMFIFNWAVGGTRDLERFRQERENGMASIQHSLDMADSAESVTSS